jgi:hypothetical protein
VGKVERKWQDTEYVLSFFGNGRAGRRNYRKYVEDGIALGRRPELVGGGLIRSLWDWSEVLSLRERGERHAFDQRILGDSEFVQEVISGLDDITKRNLRLSGRRIDFYTLTERVCKNHDISSGELRSGSRRHKVVKGRPVLFWFGVRGIFRCRGGRVSRCEYLMRKSIYSIRKKTGRRFQNSCVVNSLHQRSHLHIKN